jgi:DNA-binding response OmpR family regulator
MEKKRKILIIDDDDEIRENYADVFRHNGFEVIEAEDGVDGLDKATKYLPDVIFTGIMMPRMDGFGMVEVLNKNVATQNIPIAMNSHMGRDEDRTRAFAMGVGDFFIKGMDTPKNILERIKILMDIKSGIYKIKVDVNELDAPRLATDLKFENGLLCKNCGREMILSLRKIELIKNNYSVDLICPVCQK